MTVRFFKKNLKAYAKTLALLFVVPVLTMLVQNSYALELTQRSIRLTSSAPGATSDHVVSFDVRTASSLGSIVFEYCSNSPLHNDPCTAPAGLDTSTLSLVQQVGETGFSLHGNSDANTIILTRPPSVATPQNVLYRFNDIINPNTPRQTVFVRLSTHTADDGSGSRTDDGAVVFSTDGGLAAELFVPPYLTLCVGVTVASDCSSSVGDTIDLGILSSSVSSTASSQFAAATNDFTGYNVAIAGTTMTSGSNVIPALAVPAISTSGVSQFGINLRANTNPSVGLNPSGIGTSVISANYNIINNFSFVNGSTLVSSPISTDFNRFTVSYMVNVSSIQPPGFYAATFTYIATASF
jgi:hypothetical protein